ncbi:MAG: hypothetical protein KBC43_05830 [Bacteroidales bacterium]|nr:hypothetical protein [Bacteroidales bacterium]
MKTIKYLFLFLFVCVFADLFAQQENKTEGITKTGTGEGSPALTDTPANQPPEGHSIPSVEAPALIGTAQELVKSDLDRVDEPNAASPDPKAISSGSVLEGEIKDKETGIKEYNEPNAASPPKGDIPEIQ